MNLDYTKNKAYSDSSYGSGDGYGKGGYGGYGDSIDEDKKKVATSIINAISVGVESNLEVQASFDNILSSILLKLNNSLTKYDPDIAKAYEDILTRLLNSYDSVRAGYRTFQKTVAKILN